MAAKKRTKKKAGSSSRKHPAKKRSASKKAPRRKAIHRRKAVSGNANLVNYVRAVRAAHGEAVRTRALQRIAALPGASKARRLPSPWEVRAKNIERSTTTAIVPYRETSSAIVPFRPRKPKGRVYRAGPVRNVSHVSDVVHSPFKSTTPFKLRVEQLMATGLTQGQAWAQAMKERRSANATGKRAEAIAKKARRSVSRSSRKKRSAKKKAAHAAKKKATHSAKKKRHAKKTAHSAATPAATHSPSKKRHGKKRPSSKKRHGSKKRAGKKKTTHHVASPRAGKKRRGRKTTRHSTGASTSTSASSAPARRTHSKLSQKFRLMDSYGLPSKRGVSKAKAKKVREAAGKSITHAQIMEDIAAKKLVGWVCVGRVRTGCGGGSKMLRGSHQIGVIKGIKR